MSFIAILGIGLALAVDSMTVSLAASTAGQITSRRAAFRLAFHLGLFQGLMPIIGCGIGNTIEPIIADFDHWIAFALLMFVAVNMLRSGLDASPAQKSYNPSRGFTLIMLSIATSIDALAVGLSLKMLDVSVWLPGIIFGIITLLVCLLAMAAGERIGRWVDRQAQFVGSAVLIFIAIRIVISHTT